MKKIFFKGIERKTIMAKSLWVINEKKNWRELMYELYKELSREIGEVNFENLIYALKDILNVDSWDDAYYIYDTLGEFECFTTYIEEWEDFISEIFKDKICCFTFQYYIDEREVEEVW